MPAEERQRRLLRFLCITGPVHDELTLYALAFLAQRLGLLDNLYEFDLGMNVPVSTTLGSDLYCLFSRGHLADSGKPGTISITERGAQHSGHDPREVRPGAAQKARTLAGLEPGVILALPHVSSLADSAAGPERDVSLNAVITEAIAEYGRKIERREVLRQLEDFHKELRASGRKGSDSVELLREMRKERTDARTGPSNRSTGGGKP
jgi:hypothetical protein